VGRSLWILSHNTHLWGRILKKKYLHELSLRGEHLLPKAFSVTNFGKNSKNPLLQPPLLAVEVLRMFHITKKIGWAEVVADVFLVLLLSKRIGVPLNKTPWCVYKHQMHTRNKLHKLPQNVHKNTKMHQCAIR
jgi:hypothetical protein